MATPAAIFKNNATSRLFADVDETSITIRVQDEDGGLFPTPGVDEYFMVTIEDRRTGQIEICKATARSGDIITVVRGQEGTEPQDFAMGATVSNRLTAGTMAAFFGFSYDKVTSDSRYVNITGDTMTGALLLNPVMPTNNLEAAHKAYVDARVAAAGQVTVASTVSLVYQLAAGTTTISLSTLDIYAQTYLLNPGLVEPVDVFVNGIKKVQNNTGGVGDFTINRGTNQIIFDSALSTGDFVSIDIYSPRNVATGPVSMNLLAQVSPLPTGAETQFTLRKALDNTLIDVMRSDEVLLYVNNIPQRPGSDYSVFGSMVTFAEPPEADAIIWGLWVKTSVGTV